MDAPEPQRKAAQNADVQTGRNAFWQAVGFAWDFGIVVITPLLAFGLGGRLLDKQLGTHPWIFLGGVIVAIIISTVLLIMRLQQILKKITTTPKDK